MTITDLSIGQSAQITHVNLISPHAPRLLEMGFVPGARITLLARAPLGEPLLLQLRTRTLMLRKSEAQSVILQMEKMS